MIAAEVAALQFASSYRAHGWWRNPHAQSILPRLPPWSILARRRAEPLRRLSSPWMLDCGAGVRLEAWHTPAPNSASGPRAALLLHGWEGSAESIYLLSLAQRLHQAGYAVVRLNLRDHGDTHHLNRELFHSCLLDEVAGAVRAIAARLPSARLFLAGFSLGGNFMLRVAAAPELPASVAGVAAVSPVLDPAHALHAMEIDNPVYQRYFVRKWRRSLLRKQQCWPGAFDFSELQRDLSLTPMTDVLVRRHTEYPSLKDYFNGYAITGARLASLAVPARVLASADDPIIPAGDLARLAPSPLLRVELAPHGGHCGFVRNWRGDSYADEFVLRAFAECDNLANPCARRTAAACLNAGPIAGS